MRQWLFGRGLLGDLSGWPDVFRARDLQQRNVYVCGGLHRFELLDPLWKQRQLSEQHRLQQQQPVQLVRLHQRPLPFARVRASLQPGCIVRGQLRLRIPGLHGGALRATGVLA